MTRLRVQRAPEPDDILFENLEVSGLNKFARRLRTTTAMFLALLICFFVILQASRYRQQFSSSIPNLAYCSTIIPQQYTASTTNADVSSVTLVRPPDTLISYYDSQCEAVVGGTFYAVYSRSNSIKKPVVSYDISSCTRPSPFGLCPSVNEVSYCPCLSVQASDLCSTYQCTTVGASSKACLNYQTKLLADCYCASELSSLVKDGKGLAALTSYSQASSTPQCKAFYSGYIVVEVLTYSATFLVVIIGKVLEAFVGVLNRAEKHSCLSEAQGSYMKKIFISLYINMALVVLIVFGRVNGLPSAFAQASVLQGIYPDFTAAWYGNVGAYLLLTFIVQIASVPLWSLFQYFISHPFARWLVYPSIRKCTNTSIIIQDDLNAYEVGPIFETSYATAQSLALLFFAMTFATGIPLLIPLACIAFTMFFTVDKFLICRFYQRPPKISEGVIRSAITLLPFAAILRLAIACWMLSARDIFTSNIIQLNTQRLGSDILVSGPISYAQERLLRPNIFPLFILLLLTVAYYPLRFIFRYIIPLELLISVFRKCFCTQKHETAVSSRRDGITGYELMLLNDELRQEAAPFSEQYYSYVLSQEKAVKFCRPLCRKKESLFEELSKQEQREGWLHVGRGRHVLKCKVWTQTTDLGYTVRRPGEFKKTHEVIADAGCNSFNLASIPVYKKAIIALEQGAKNLQLDAAILVEKVDKQRRRSSRNRLSMTLEDTVSMESFDEGSAFDYDIESTSTIGNKVVSFKRTPSMSGNHFSTLATSDSEGDDVWESSDSEKEQDDADNDDIFKKESAQTDQNTLANCTRRSKPSPHPSSMPFARSKKVAAVRFSL